MASMKDSFLKWAWKVMEKADPKSKEYKDAEKVWAEYADESDKKKRP